MTAFSPSPVTIRRVDGGEACHDLYSLQEACLPLDSPTDVSLGWWWLAFDDEEPVGFGGYVRSHQWHDTIYLVRAGVLPSHRGYGLQKQLIRVRLAAAKKAGFNWAITETTHNPASANSLISCGFKTYLPSKPWSYEAAIYFRKRLAAQ